MISPARQLHAVVAETFCLAANLVERQIRPLTCKQRYRSRHEFFSLEIRSNAAEWDRKRPRVSIDPAARRPATRQRQHQPINWPARKRQHHRPKATPKQTAT